MAYLYRHIRLDKNEPFYIGIGSDDGYGRAYDKRSRNRYWKFIASKTDYQVEVVIDNLTWEEACEKEKEFIKLYGRKDLNRGTLCNLTEGGEGVLGHTVSEDVKKSIKEKFSKPVIQYDLKGNFLKEWNSISEASTSLNIDCSGIAKCCKGVENRKSIGGYVWRYRDNYKWFNPLYICNTGISESNKHQRERRKKEVLQISLEGVIIKEWKSPTDAAKYYNTTKENIYRSIKNNLTAVGFKWKYRIINNI